MTVITVIFTETVMTNNYNNDHAIVFVIILLTM